MKKSCAPIFSSLEKSLYLYINQAKINIEKEYKSVKTGLSSHMLLFTLLKKLPNKFPASTCSAVLEIVFETVLDIVLEKVLDISKATNRSEVVDFESGIESDWSISGSVSDWSISGSVSDWSISGSVDA